MSQGESSLEGTAALEIHSAFAHRSAARSSPAHPLRNGSCDVRPSNPLVYVDAGISPEAAAGLSLLLQAHIYCESFERDAWDFAVEILCLRRAGLTNNTLRWMVCRGWLDHAQEVSSGGATTRVFRDSGLLAFDKTTCFVLTESGIEAATQVCQVRTDQGEPSAVVLRAEQSQPASVPNGRQSASTCPYWDPELHQLRVGELIIKEFKLPCPNQGTILMAFEEEGWPKRIDDPLPPRPELDSRTRLRYTIKSLNKKQKNRLIRFMGDGTGKGVRWQFLSNALTGLQD